MTKAQLATQATATTDNEIFAFALLSFTARCMT